MATTIINLSSNINPLGAPDLREQVSMRRCAQSEPESPTARQPRNVDSIGVLALTAVCH
jgi:hypothetical protein